jgi:hypothetical protein
MASNFKVRHVAGTSDRTCGCGTWLEHFRKFTTGKTPLLCPVTDCFGNVEVGAHVYVLDSRGDTDMREFIVPMCHSCNQTEVDLWIAGTIMHVTANKTKTGC